MRWLTIGSRKIGVECAYLVLSALCMYLFHTYTLRPSTENFDSNLFYGIFYYNVITYISLVLSNPGRIDDLGYLIDLDTMVSTLFVMLI